MKRFISFVLILILALAAVGCTGKPDPEANATEAPATEPADSEAPAGTPEATEKPAETGEPAGPTAEAAEPTPVPTAMPERPGENPDLPKVIAGEDLFFIAMPDGALYGWGNNEYGKLGVGDAESRKKPVLVANGLVPVIVGETVFALSSDNVLWGWGRNDLGQLGLGDTENRTRPEELMHFVKAVVKGAHSFYALTESGEVYEWGLDPVFYSEEVDLSVIAEPVLILENVALCDGEYAIKQNGELWRSWGYEWRLVTSGVRNVWHSGDTVAVEAEDGCLYAIGSRDAVFFEKDPERALVAESFRSVTVSDGYIWVLSNDGSLYYYKANYSSLIPIEVETGFDTLTFVMNGVVEFAADTYLDEDWGYDYKFALKANGELWAWGEYPEPVLGKTQMSDPTVPECVAHGVRSFVSTGAQTYIIAEDGSVWATGLGSEEGYVFGGLGDGTDATRYGFVYLGIEGFCTVTCRMDNDIIENEAGDTGNRICCRTFAVDAEGGIYAWGWNGDGLLGVGADEEIVLSPVKIEPMR